jgi:hypothetical protein
MQEKHLSHQKYHFAHIFPSMASFGLADQSVVKEPLPHLGTPVVNTSSEPTETPRIPVRIVFVFLAQLRPC